MPKSKSSSKSLAKLKACCKMNMYNVKISGTKTPLEGFADTFVCVRKEEIKPGEFEYVHRVMISGDKTIYNNIGWVVDGDCAACMRCHTGFGLMQWKHHCRACGDCVCAGCSYHRMDLTNECDGLKENGGSRVCIQCYADIHFRIAKMYDEASGRVEAANPVVQDASGKDEMPKSILKQPKPGNDAKVQDVSPVTAMLNSLSGRWDRSDDGISTPGTTTTDAGESIKTTPDSDVQYDEAVKSVKSVASAKSDKYFFTPNSAFGDTTTGAENRHNHGRISTVNDKKQARKVLRDVTLESTSPHISSESTPSLNKFSPLPDTPSTTATTSPKDISSVSKFVPVPSFVIKGCIDHWDGSVGCSKTIYVNVCKHGSLPSPSAKELQVNNMAASYVIGPVKDIERDGESALTVDLCYHSQVHVWAYADENGQNLSALAEHAVVCVNATHKLNMYISSLPQWTTYFGHIKALDMCVHEGQPVMTQ